MAQDIISDWAGPEFFEQLEAAKAGIRRLRRTIKRMDTIHFQYVFLIGMGNGTGKGAVRLGKN